MDTQHNPTCRHHWSLSSPEGDRVVGRCRRCDAVRIYPAFGADWEVPAERAEIGALGGDHSLREATERLRWSA